MPPVPLRSFGPPQPDTAQGEQREKTSNTFKNGLQQSESVWTILCHTMLGVDVSANNVFNPGYVRRGAGEYGWLLVHDAADGAEAGYAMNLPWVSGDHSILAHQRASRIPLLKSQINIQTEIQLNPGLHNESVGLDLTDGLEIIGQVVATAHHGGLDLEPPVIHPLAGVIRYNG